MRFHRLAETVPSSPKPKPRAKKQLARGPRGENSPLRSTRQALTKGSTGSPNLTEATACFTSLPAVELEPECTVSWGALPLGGPVGDTLENAILDMVPPKVLEMVKDEWTAPNAVTVSLVDKGFWSRFEGAAESRAVRTSYPRPDRLLNAPVCVQEEAAGLAARRLAAEAG